MLSRISKLGIIISLASIGLSCISCSKCDDKTELTIIPQPTSIKYNSGMFTFSERTTIAVDNKEELKIAEAFSSLFTKSAGFTPQIIVNNNGDISFSIDSNMKEDAYHLNITENKINIKAKNSKGFFYALQTIRLMLPGNIESKTSSINKWCIPATDIYDEPRFYYRGFMLDVARYFMPKEDVMKMIDCMSMLKLNKLHLHLTDDNGWRLEIKKYPKLTEVGAWRVDRQNLPFPDRRNPRKGEPTTVGGFYTQDDMKEIIEYASIRQIEIIPEIDIPAHSNAALASYPEYACPTVDKYIGVLPGLGGRNAEIIFCAGNDKSFEFLQGILDEIINLFPSRYIHLGGDEANKSNWKKCPLCQSRIRKENLKDEEALQGYFMGRMSDYVRSKGKEVMGWDELTNSKLPENSIIFGWQGYGNAALKAAEQGHRFIMTPARVAYLIRYQGPQWFEPLTYFGNNTLKDLFNYEPVQNSWKPEYENLLYGVQASMWTEFCDKSEDVFYQVFPRLAALAEIAWVPKGKKDWNMFIKGLDNYLSHLDNKGIVYARSMFNIQHKIVPDSIGNLIVNLTCERPDVDIRYTTDGTEPNAESELYTGTFSVADNKTIKANTFKNDMKMGKTLELQLNYNKATGKRFVENIPGTDILLNGLRGSLRQSDFEWYTGNLMKPVILTLDLQKAETIKKCTIGCLTNYGMGVHKPKNITIEVSDDNKIFNKVSEASFKKEEIFKEGNFIDDISFELKDISCRYIKLILETPGLCPEDHVRPGQASKICIDEIIVE